MVLPFAEKKPDSYSIRALSADLCGIKLRNPTVLASGLMGFNGETLLRIARSGAGAVTTKSIGQREQLGHKNPKVVAWEHGLINCVGLSSPGYKGMEEEWLVLEKRPVPVFASVYGNSVDEYARVAGFVATKRPELIEINMSCPHSKGQGSAFGSDAGLAAEVVSAVKGAVEDAAKSSAGSDAENAGNKNSKHRIPVFAKLTPNVPDIVSIAAACKDAGADGFTAINTLGPGMLIDLETAKPVLSNKFGGISGPAVKPIALRCVYQLCGQLRMPVIGMGGITTGQDALQFIMAGATAVGIGSGIYYRGIDIFHKVCVEMQQWLDAHGHKTLNEIRGIAVG